MTISFGKNPERPKPRLWANAMGFSLTEWLDSDGHILNKPPAVNNSYLIRLPANFIASADETITLHWRPADSSINGFDQSNIEELAQLRFATGSVSRPNTSDKTIVFQPRTIRFPNELLSLSARPVSETDTLTDCQRWEHSFGRYKCVEFNMESNVTSQYVFLDEQLIMLEHSVWADAHFWIGNGKLTPSLASKILLTNGG